MNDRVVGPGDPPVSRIVPTADVGQAAARARRLIMAGKSVVLPTDTVYGIAADAFDAEAVQRLLDAKGRGRDMPPPVLVADLVVAQALAAEIPAAAAELMERFWPGPLTLVLRAQPSLRLDLGDAEGTVAVRVPDHDVTRAVLRVTGPLAVSSANRTGQPAARTAEEAEQQLGLSVAAYLDAGRSSEGPSSTIVDFVSNPEGRILRHGGITLAQLREVVPGLHDGGSAQSTDSTGAAVEAGTPQMPAHPDETNTEPTVSGPESPTMPESSTMPDSFTMPEDPTMQGDDSANAAGSSAAGETGSRPTDA